LEPFFSAAYWRRVWVIQEIAVALSVTILQGGKEAKWEGIAELISELGKAPNIKPNHRHIYRNTFHISEFRSRFRRRESIGILDAMKLSGHTLATDSRDKIFALLGLCYDGTTYVPLPNYKQPLETVITDIVRTIMSTNRSLDLMLLKGTGRRSKLSLPTWVPDLTAVWSGSMTIQENTFDQWQTLTAPTTVSSWSRASFLVTLADSVLG
jgi:hypothetical protein